METKYLVGVLVLIVAISGATACSFLLPSSNPLQNNAATSVSSPVAGNDSGTQEQTQKPANNQKTVQAQKVTCTKCGGSGKLKGSCVTCGGDGKISCPGCGGDGYT